MSPTTLVSTDQLAQRLEHWRIFDCRHDLAQPQLGEQQYGEAHIPGALFAHLDRDLSAPKTGKNGRHPLPDPQQFIRFIEKSGIQPSDRVVCYDAGTGAMAARLWWMLRWVGHEAVAVLDGGLAKWLRESRPVDAIVPHFIPTRYSARLREDAALPVDAVQKNLQKLLLVDARAPARYRGEQEPIDPVAGRIPGALNRFNSENLSADGLFKTSKELKVEFSKLLGSTSPTQVLNYCGSGVAACHNLLAMEIAGLPGGKLYAGSWSEWSADPARPRERG